MKGRSKFVESFRERRPVTGSLLKTKQIEVRPGAAAERQAG